MKEKIRIFVCDKCCNTAYTTDGSIPGACTSQYWVRTSGICGGHYSEIEGADFDWVVNQEVGKRIKERMPSEEDKAIRKFFLWMVREANIEVIDAEKAIEVHSLKSEVGLVPVISIDELIEYYRFCLTSSEKSNNSQKTEGGGE